MAFNVKTSSPIRILLKSYVRSKNVHNNILLFMRAMTVRRPNGTQTEFVVHIYYYHYYSVEAIYKRV